MRRLPRLHVPGGLYHVILRGDRHGWWKHWQCRSNCQCNHRENLFSTIGDRLALNEIVAEALTKTSSRLHAFCWMTNHLHTLLQVGEMPLGKVMQRIAVAYSRRRHRRLRTTGHLFERRYRAKLVQADLYFVTLLRYIHLNPVQAGMVKHAEQYRWSSHRAYLGLENLSWVHIDFGLSLFGGAIESARQGYRALMAQELVASEAGVVDEGHVSDRRVLGTDDFLATLKPPQIRRKSPLTQMQLAEHLCAARSISAEEIRSPSKRQSLSAVRAEFSRQALDGRIASLHEIARFLGRSPSSVFALVERHSKRGSAG